MTNSIDYVTVPLSQLILYPTKATEKQIFKHREKHNDCLQKEIIYTHRNIQYVEMYKDILTVNRHTVCSYERYFLSVLFCYV